MDYLVKRSTTSDGQYTCVIIAGPSPTTYTDTTAVNGTTYYYVVSAVNCGGESANSSEVSATPNITVKTFSTPNTYTWQCPNEIVGGLLVECWGGGGGGGAMYCSSPHDVGAGGGGGGAYAAKVVNVVPGQVYTLIVGAGGDGNNGGNGGDSTFGTTIVVAKGVMGVASSSYVGGKGGQAKKCTGDITYSGGDGASVDASGDGFGSGGGGGAGSTSAGGNGSSCYGSQGGIGGVGGGGTDRAHWGGTGGNGAQTVQVSEGGTGACPGGGGGGSFNCLPSEFHFTIPGPAGGAGKIMLSYTTPDN